MKDKKITFQIDTESSFMKEGYSVRILGDYVVEAFIPENLAPFFENIYKNTTMIESFDLAIFREIFNVKTETTLRVTHDKHLAHALKEQILDGFPGKMKI